MAAFLFALFNPIFLMKPGKVFYSVLNMGLGHASRSLPIIQEFINRKWQVWIGSNGRSLQFLKRELPHLTFVETPDYGISYAHGRFFLPKLALQIPQMLNKIRAERKLCNHIVNRFSPDLIFSDHCYGMYHSQIPCYFLSHQIYFAPPGYLQFLSHLISRFNLIFHHHYQKIVIPDLPADGHGLLSGSLSQLPSLERKYYLVGILSSVKKLPAKKSIDFLFSISGPEPQRTIFEKIVLKQVKGLQGEKVVVLGKSEENKMIINDHGLKIYTHLPRSEMEMVFNQSALIVTRPGYSTLMELVETGKKALLIPTPGQTEQEYLAERMVKKNWFHAVGQAQINLSKDIEVAKSFDGLSRPNTTEKTINFIFNNIITG